MSRLDVAGVRGATTAVVCADLGAANDVISRDASVNELYRSIDELAVDVLARQRPVDSDLRSCVTALRIATDLERAGDDAVPPLPLRLEGGVPAGVTSRTPGARQSLRRRL